MCQAACWALWSSVEQDKPLGWLRTYFVSVLIAWEVRIIALILQVRQLRTEAPQL